ncbi:hypothetical protein BJ165DRAFT_1492988 [Panaeolus papilionaceus]|nr:hypothetical protein BJ165DRAFT_1492988 [Panaeolus papilionaceus]
MTALQFILDSRYEQDPDACLSNWPLSGASPQTMVTLDIPSNHGPALASPLQVPGLEQLSITPAPIPSTPQFQPPSPDTSCFAPMAAAIKRRFKQIRG